jgi:predicted dehydrogenase
VNVALIGYRFMGKVHSHAYHDMPFFFRTDHVPVRRVICGRSEGALREAADRWGWQEVDTDWRRVVERNDIHLIDVSAPDVLHHDIVMAAAAAGKHILCEKPLAMTVADAQEMVDAVERAGVAHMIAHQLRKVPALLHARRLIEEGALGRILHVRALWTNEMGIDPDYPLVWRFRREHVGRRGVIANLASHLIDLIRFLAGEIVEVVGSASTHITSRPLPTEGTARPIAGARGEVTVFDEACFLARLEGGASAVVEASWVAAGHKHGQRIEVNGTEGSLSFEFERMNELQVSFRRDPSTSGGFRRILITEPDHPYVSAWWPRGHGIAYEHLFIHMVYEFMDALDRGTVPAPNFHDGLMVNRVMDAVEASVEQRRWVTV